MDAIVIATRESRLALWQARHVQAVLADRLGLEADLLAMTTRGDRILDRTLSKVGGKGLFVKELERALETGEAHIAVHSLKDVPMTLPDGFRLAAVLQREDPRDAFVSNTYACLDDLPLGAVVGTSSLRRVAQVLARRPDLQLKPLRGNLDTRCAKLDAGDYDAILLAAAGLVRLGLESRIRDRFALDFMTPAAGQGALGLEIRADAHALHERLATLRDESTWLAVHAERAVARALSGSCTLPLASYAQRAVDGTFTLSAALGDALLAATLEAPTNAPAPGSIGARPLLRAQATARVEDVAAAEALGRRVADDLLRQGGAAYLPVDD
ncbi:MAG TPA: hydroxymethylbilane synthase [Burkholderiaceae bacterium]|jgi:hydroxymethylbilane synthase|nr:hydroxymethylbilane synthase [Burkholderiaceae bacterium]